MKIGACVWEFVEHAERRRRYPSGRPVVALEGLPDQFFPPSEKPEIDLDDPLVWLIRNCDRYGLEALEVASPMFEELARDPKRLEQIQGLLDQHRVTLATNYHDDFMAPERTLDDLKLHVLTARELGIGAIGIGGMPFSVNRFADEPSLTRQFEIIVEHLKPWVEAAGEAGVILAFENHADYRCGELIEHVIEPIGSEYLGLKLDTGNCLLVIDDAVGAARVAAPVCHAMHLKDMYVHPVTPLGGLIVGAPVGLGHCQLDVVAEVLAESAPAPDDLVAAIEINWMPDNDDYFQWLRESVRWCREHLPGKEGR